MNVNSMVVLVAQKIKDISQPYKLADSEIKNQIRNAVKDYSKRRPMKKRHTFNVEVDTDTYPLPADFIHAIYVPTESTFLSPDKKVRFTAGGLVPVGSYDLPEEYMIQGTQIELRPTPSVSYSMDMTYAALHAASGSGASEAFATIPVIDDDLIELKAAIGCLETLISEMARKNFKYTTGTTTIDKSGQAKDMKALATKWSDEYTDRMLRPAGARS